MKNRWWVVLFHYGNTIILILVIGYLTVTEGFASEIDKIVENAKIINETINNNDYQWLNVQETSQFNEVVQKIKRKSLPIITSKIEQNSSQYEDIKKEKILIFASLSIPEKTLRNLLEQAEDSNVVMIFRGIPEGLKLKDLVIKLNTLTNDVSNPGSVVLDPTLFIRYGVDTVPTMVYVKEGSSTVIKVKGPVTKEWLIKRAKKLLENEKKGIKQIIDQGQYGEIYPIIERDIIEVLKERVKNIDWAKKKKDALDRYWKNKKDFVDLKIAQENRSYTVDPTVETTEDIRDKNDNVIVPAGSKFNPLDYISKLSKTVIIFDGTDKVQRKFASEQIQESYKNHKGVIAITTKVDTKDGWRSLDEIENEIKAPIYILQEDLATAFNLKNIPAIVSSKGRKLLITEYSMDK